MTRVTPSLERFARGPMWVPPMGMESANLAAYQTNRAGFSFGQAAGGATRHGTMTWTYTHRLAPQGGRKWSGLRIPARQATEACREVLTTRKPLLLLRLSGLLLLREAPRAQEASLL